MIFSRDGWRSVVSRLLVAAAAASLLAACGGGDQVNAFRAGRVLAFGDENSVIDGSGRKYTVNFVSAATAVPPSTLNCALQPIWVQSVAAQYGLSFEECPGSGNPAGGRILAAPDATVAQVRAQIDAFVAGDAFRSTDLVTLLVGAHDIHGLYARTAAGDLSLADASLAAGQAGVQLAAQVNRIAALGAKVLIVTIPDQGFTPEGRSALTPAGAADPNKAATLSELTRLFNNGLRSRELDNDGRKIGLVLFDESVRSFVDSGNFNVVTPACDDTTVGDVLTCTTQTLRAGADLNTWLWADRLHMATLGHLNLGSLAVTRATNNPF